MKLQLTDITPAEFACGGPTSSCPAVLKSEQDIYVIIGKVYDEGEPDLHQRVGPGEIAIEISAELLEAAVLKAMSVRWRANG